MSVILFLAVCFKNAKQYEQAKDAYLKEAEYHTENKAYPHCADFKYSYVQINLFVSVL